MEAEREAENEKKKDEEIVKLKKTVERERSNKDKLRNSQSDLKKDQHKSLMEQDPKMNDTEKLIL